MNYSARCTIDDVLVNAPGAIVLPNRMFLTIVKKLEGERIVLEANESNNVVITCGRSHYELVGIPAEEYPELPLVEPESDIVFEGSEFRRAISEVSYAIREDEARPVLCGALLQKSGENELTMVAMDGFRAATKTFPATKISLNSRNSVVLNKFFLSELLKSLPNDETPVSLEIGTRHAIVKFRDEKNGFEQEIVTRLIEGSYPDWARFFTEPMYHVVADRKDLLACTDRMKLLVNDKIKAPLKMTVSADSIDMHVHTANGRAHDVIAVKSSDIKDSLVIGFNTSYLFDVLRSMEGDLVSLGFTSPSSPCVLNPVEPESNGKHLLLPVRLKAE
jgi:DNA polymerase-3 subunit beta